MFIFDGRITLEDRALLEEYLNGFDYRTSGLSFTSLFMWKEINMFSWEIIGDYLCITGADNLDPVMGEPFMLPPLTRTGVYEPVGLRAAITEAKRRFEEKGKPFNMMLVPVPVLAALGEAMPGELEFEEDRANFDYVYDTRELAELKGRAFHSKKNHLNYFLANYAYEYGPLLPDMADEAMDFIRAFNERKNLEDPHERELLAFEERAMQDVFHHLDTVGYLTGAIRIGGRIEALSIGGHLGGNTVTVHIEKANTEFRGLYQAINNEFCKGMDAGITRINREEDMGIPGLRKAKLSYNPIELIEKYTVRLKNPCSS
ncbi:MAG: phosphatidylglycerol lysyltransferase domain-containing protein [Clostridiales Family XIII bacterium]|jgi:hypothetical protein|nr:phosphatidylglycerol lysyltransferase domain-containing protein [Clostridiales Family XIII bacterium]